MRRRFVELAPWVANGTASAADRAWVERYLRSHRQARAELEWYASLRQSIRADAPERAPDAGLERLLHRVRLERQPVPRDPKIGLAPLLGPLLGPLRVFISSIAMRPVIAYGALALVVVALFDPQATEREYAEYRALVSVQASGPVLRVTFKVDAEERDIRNALLDIGGTLVGGPGQLGEYLVRVAPAKLDTAAARLRGNVVIEAVEISVNP
jgi:hypothetical protein